MNLRTLKKKCKRAVAILIAEHGYDRSDFVPADGDESIYAPPTMEKRYIASYGTFLRRGPLKGTLLYSYQSSYEYNEWDVKLPNEVLAEIEYWNGLSDEDVKRMLEDDGAGCRN